MSTHPTRVLVMAGGTGGHVFPGLAVADCLRGRGCHVEWLGTRAGLECRVVPAAGIALHCIEVSGLRGKGWLGWMLAPVRIARALWASLRVLRRSRPHVVLGMGGFASGPGGVAAWLARRPLVVHEQNAVPGLTNRILSRFAVRCLEAFPGSFAPTTGAEHVGNPVRESVAAIAPLRAEKPEPIHLLVLGGSQGALALNRMVPQALGRLGAALHIEVVHQCGAAHAALAEAAYGDAGVDATVEPFIEDIAKAYAWADLVVCRAGAMTVAELAVAGRPALFVPFPYAVDDHQSANARFLADAGAAEMVRESELDAEALAGRLRRLIGDRSGLARMGQLARERAMPRATARVADICEEVAFA